MPIPLYWSTGRYVMNSIQPTGIFSIHRLFWFGGFSGIYCQKFTQPTISRNSWISCWIRYKSLIFRLKLLNFQRSKSNVITTGETSGVSLKYIPFSQATSMYWPKTLGLRPRVLGQYMLVAWLQGMYFVIHLLSIHHKTWVSMIWLYLMSELSE